MKRVRNHLLFWLTYVLFKTYLNVSHELDMPLSSYLSIILSQLSFLIVKVPVVYFCFYVIDQYLEIKWNLWSVVIILIATFLAGVVGMSVINHHIVMPILGMTSSLSILSPPSLIYHTFTLTFVAGSATAIRLFRRQHTLKLREAILQKEKTETELKYLKGQINPHFLFNTLNNIYSLARKGSPQTAEAVLRLSKLMRFVLYEAGEASILLQEELTLIKDYIQLEQLRYTDRLQVTYANSIDNPNQRIAPLLLVHFVENAFKHGASESRQDSFISVDITLKQQTLKATIINSKSEELKPERSSLGLENIKKQLNIIYPNHELTIVDEKKKFTVTLLIPLPA